MAIYETSRHIVNRLLLDEPKEFCELPCAFFVHTLIINEWVKVMHKMFTNNDWEMYEQILQIRRKQYKISLIIVLRATKDQLNFLHGSIKNSQISFPWEQNPTLFVESAEFNIMEEFIKHHKLEAYILKIEEKLGITVSGDHRIKVVSFNQSVNAKVDIIYEFKKLWKDKNKCYLFMIFGFPWHESYWLHKNLLNDDFYSVFPIILRHLGTLNYANDLNIMDLLSLRLAISDVRDPFKSNHLMYEIDFMIKRVLAKLVEYNHLNIMNYLIAKNSKPSELLIFYLVYEFQNFFETLDMEDVYGYREDKSILLHDTIKLNGEIDVLNKLKERLNVRHCIDGKCFDRMNLSLFEGLIESENVYAIELDTNYRFLNNPPISELNRIITAYKVVDFNEVNIYLRGENTYNFIEDFVAALKTITFVNYRIILHIYCNLNDYRIFDNLMVAEVQFRNIHIDLNMVENLQQCKPSISLYQCSIENNSRNWELLNNLEKLKASIYEDEGMWLSMFEFILKEIHKSNTNEFQFNSKSKFDIIQKRTPSSLIDLHIMKFTVDEQNSKLEIRKIDTNAIVDLYCEKCVIHQQEKSDYEFYN